MQRATRDLRAAGVGKSPSATLSRARGRADVVRGVLEHPEQFQLWVLVLYLDWQLDLSILNVGTG